MMTLEAFYFIAQIIAAVAIVGSLLFVGQQIKTSNAEQRLARINERATLTEKISSYMIHSPELRGILQKAGRASYRDLNTEERVLYGAFALQLMQMQVSIFAHLREGHDDDQTITSVRNISSRTLASSLFAGWWADYGKEYSPEIQAFVNDAIARRKVILEERPHDA